MPECMPLSYPARQAPLLSQHVRPQGADLCCCSLCMQVPFPARSIESLQTTISLTVLANTGPSRAGVDEEAGPSSGRETTAPASSGRGSGGSNWQPLVRDIKLGSRLPAVCAPECERHAWVLGRLGTAQGGFGPNCCRFLNSTSPHREVICRYTRPCLGTGQQSERKHTSVRVRHAWALGRCCGSLMHRAMPTDCSCACLGQAAEQVSNEVYDV